MKFCSNCSNPVIHKIPKGDNRMRHVCTACETIFYSNPNIIAGCIIEYQGKILLCKRAIEPRYGTWTVPAGFMENKETVEQAALRESYEEALAVPSKLSLFAIYNLPDISQVYILYTGSLTTNNFGAGEESLEVALYDEADIPWDEIAFKAVKHALTEYLRMRKENKFSLVEETIHHK